MLRRRIGFGQQGGIAPDGLLRSKMPDYLGTPDEGHTDRARDHLSKRQAAGNAEITPPASHEHLDNAPGC